MRFSILVFVLIVLFVSKLSGQERYFKDVDLELLSKIKLADNNIFKVHSLEINNLGDIVFFDFGENRIVKTDTNGVVFDFYGNGKGRGPEEFIQVMDLKITDTKILISDREKNRLIKWDLNGEFDKEIKLEGKFIKPSRIAICNDLEAVFLLSAQYSPNGILHYFDENFNLINSFIEIKEADKRMPYYTDGNLACDENKNLYYATRYVNSIKSFNSKGKVIFDIPVYKFISNDKIMEKNGRWFSPAEGVRRASGDLYVLDQNLLVGFSDSKYIESKLIDVYEKDNGKYSYSIKIPTKFTEFALNRNHLVLFVLDKDGETNLHIYSYNNLK